MQLITTKDREPQYEPGTVIEAESRDDRPLAPVLWEGESIDDVILTTLQYQRLVYRDTGGPVQHVLAAMVFIWGGRGDSGYLEAWPSKATIASATGLSESTVFRHLKTAEAADWLIVETQRSPRTGHLHNHYTFAVPEVSLTVGLFDTSPIK